uniref:Dihydroorotate dehydrogenase electron transfer subunit n=1 Tax=Geoglobus ahangari TaxID=113653 RepID=A0A7C4S4U7_9EURY
MFSVRVKKVKRYNKSISTIIFDKELRSYPGQFIMLNVFGLEEIPLSLSSPNSVTVKAVGETTQYLVNIKEGEFVGVKGPYGNMFSLTNGRALLVAGGMGIAPLHYLYLRLEECGADVRFLFGVKSQEDICLTENIKDIVIASEDGSVGIRGTVKDLIIRENLEEFDKIYVCGPKAMTKFLISYFKEKGVIDKAEFSLTGYMRCGFGVCGSCVLENGLRVCVDGPVVRGKELKDI